MSVSVYDFTCVLILFIIYMNGRSKTYDFSQKIFNLLIVFVQLFLLLDAVSWICQDNLNPVTVVLERIFMSLLFIFQGLEGLFYVFYVETFISKKKHFSPLYWGFFIFQLSISLFFMIMNIFNNCIFVITIENSYQRGPLYIYNYVLYSFYILASLFLCVFNFFKTKDKKLKRSCLISTLGISITLLGFIIQFLFMGYNLVSPSETITILMVYFSLQQKNMLDIRVESVKNLKAITFGNFDILYKGKSIKFKRSKSKELIAYLINKKGNSATLTELCAVLWEEKSSEESTKSLLRTIISDLKNTLTECGIENFFIKEYNSCKINPDLISCDYYDFLNGKQEARNSFTGQFMIQYSWAEATTGILAKAKQ